jgi:hypothetical protein
MTEEERAARYRAEGLARRKARRDRFSALAGNRQKREELDAAWSPVRLARLERDFVGDDCEFLEELYVEVPQKDVYLTEVPDDLLA